ncbi:MAG TPA: GntR family transcriptional regulator, partial [Roseateles sp.]|nr:GntR family transcriptional regulator [Roseateles sp.]
MANPQSGGENRRQYQLVADRIRALIEEEGVAPGSRLLAERELAAKLGVSRPSLREALIALEIDGRVEIRGGSGVYVCAPPAGGESATSSLGDSPAELMQARAVLEGAVIMLAAARVT